MRTYDPVTSVCFFIGFMGFMIIGQNFLNLTNLFSPNEYE